MGVLQMMTVATQNNAFRSLGHWAELGEILLSDYGLPIRSEDSPSEGRALRRVLDNTQEKGSLRTRQSCSDESRSVSSLLPVFVNYNPVFWIVRRVDSIFVITGDHGEIVEADPLFKQQTQSKPLRSPRTDLR
jgi:hypothetical protein